MKRTKQLTALFLTLFLGYSAQAQIKESETKYTFLKQNMSAIQVDLPEVSEKMLMKKFKAYLKEHKAEVGKQKGIYVAENAVFTDLSNSPVKVFFTSQSLSGGGSKLISSWSTLEGIVGTKKMRSTYVKLKSLLHNFAVEVSKEAVTEKLEKAMKEQTKMEKEQEKLQKEQERLNKSIKDNQARIEQAKKDIATAEKDIETNKDNQIKQKSDIEKKKTEVEAIKRRLESIK